MTMPAPIFVRVIALSTLWRLSTFATGEVLVRRIGLGTARDAS